MLECVAPKPARRAGDDHDILPPFRPLFELVSGRSRRNTRRVPFYVGPELIGSSFRGGVGPVNSVKDNIRERGNRREGEDEVHRYATPRSGRGAADSPKNDVSYPGRLQAGYE